MSYEGLGSAVESMTVVTAELGVGSLQRGVPRGLGLLDAAKRAFMSVLVP